MEIIKIDKFFILGLGIISSTVAWQPKRPPTDECLDVVPCLPVYIPICGFDGTCYQTFGSECELNTANCSPQNGRKFRKIKDCKCDECNEPKCPVCSKFCTLEYAPICGSNGFCYQTFSNQCGLDMANCENSSKFWIAANGTCEEYGLDYVPICGKDCAQLCPAFYAPVCACNGICYKTFGNSCELEIENCQNDPDFIPKYTGECLPNVPVCF